MPDMSPDELRQREAEHQEEVVRKIEEREASIKALEADIHRLKDDEATRSGQVEKDRQEHKATVDAMDDREFDKHLADLNHQAHREQVERSGVRLTEQGPHDK